MAVKYRRLTIDELKELEKEFVDFLVINGIVADDWERIKKEDNDKADKIIELFSDVVFEGILRKTNFLNFVSSSSIMAFQCLEEKIVLASLEAEDDSIDFTEPATFERLQKGQLTEGIKVFTQNKAYANERTIEMFKMIQQGCSISDGKWFKAISLLLVK